MRRLVQVQRISHFIHQREKTVFRIMLDFHNDEIVHFQKMTLFFTDNCNFQVTYRLIIFITHHFLRRHYHLRRVRLRELSELHQELSDDEFPRNIFFHTSFASKYLPCTPFQYVQPYSSIDRLLIYLVRAGRGRLLQLYRHRCMF